MPLDINQLTGLKYTGTVKNGNSVADNDVTRAMNDSEQRNIENVSGTTPEFPPMNMPSTRRPLMGSGITPEDVNYSMVRQIYNTQYENPIGNEVPDGFGTSRFDKRATTTAALNDIEDFRANEQSAFNKIASGTAKMGVTAATTFADSIFGTIAGLGNLAASAVNGELTDGEGSFAGNALNAFIDNPVSRALNEITKGAEDVFHNYYTQQERNNKWYQNIFTANFLGDTIIKNAGFTIGAAYGARTMAAGTAKLFGVNGMRDAYKGLVAELGSSVEGKTASQILEGIKDGSISLKNVDMMKQLEKSAKKLKMSEMALQLSGAVMAGAGEARIEAINAADELEQELREKYGDLDKRREMEKSQVIDRLQMEHPEMFTLQLTDNNTAIAVPKDDSAKVFVESQLSRIDQFYDSLEEEIQHQRAKVANAVFGMNLPLLTIGDVVQFGKFILGDYATDRITQSGIKSAATGTIKESVEKEGLKTGMESFFKSGYEAADKGDHRILKSTARGIANALTEMQEEMNQSWISSASKDYGAHKVDEFNYRLTNPDSEYRTRKWLESVHEGLRQSWGNTDDWVEGFSGFFMGAFGLPAIRINHNGKKVDVSMTGGMWDAFRNDKQDADDRAAAISKINARIQDPKFLNFYWGKIGHDATDEAKAQAAAEGDEWAYRKADEMQMINDIIAFDSVGRLQDLYDVVEYMNGINKDNIKEVLDIYENMTNVDIMGLTDDAILGRIHTNAAKMKDMLESYAKVSRSVRQLYGSQFDESIINELIWKTVRLQSIENSLSKWTSDASSNLSEAINAFKETDEKYKDKTDYQVLGTLEFEKYVKGNNPLTEEDRQWAKETLPNIRKAQVEKDSYVTILAKTSKDPSMIQKMMEIEALEKKTKEEEVRRIVIRELVKNASANELKQFMNDDYSVDDEIMEMLNEIDENESKGAKEFLGFINIASSVNTKLDEEADKKGMTDNDKAIMRQAWKTVVDSANGVGDLLRQRNPIDFAIQGMSDEHLTIINEAIDNFAKMNEYAEYLKQAEQNGNNAAATNQTFTGDSANKLPKTGKRVRIVLTPDVGAVDKGGNPVTGTYYITPNRDEHIYDNNGNRITTSHIETGQYNVTKEVVEEKILIPDTKHKGMKMPLVVMYNFPIGNSALKPGINTFIIPDDVEEPWLQKQAPVQPAPAPVTPPPANPPTNPVQPVAPSAVPPQTSGNGQAQSLVKSIPLVSATPEAAKMKIDDVVGFAMKQERGPIYIIDKDGKILGELPTSKYEKNAVYGLTELIDLLYNEFDYTKLNTDGMFISQLHTKVGYTFTGMDNTNTEIPITYMEGITPANVRDIKFIMLSGQGNMTKFNTTDSSIKESDIITTGTYSLRKGTVYMLLPGEIKNGRQMYTPIACRKTDISPTVWQILQGTVVGDQIRGTIEDMLDAANNEDEQELFNQKKNLQKWLYLKDNRENRNPNKKNDIFFSVYERKILVKVNYNLIGVAKNVDEMIALLSSLHCGIDIHEELFGSKAGIDLFYDRFVGSGLITTNLKSFSNVGRFFMDNYNPKEGKFERFSSGPTSAQQPVIPPIAATQLQPDEVQVSTPSGSFVVKRNPTIVSGVDWCYDANTGKKYTWADAVNAFGLDAARLIYAATYMQNYWVKNDSSSSVDGQFLLYTDEGHFGYDRNTGSIMDQASTDILKAKINQKLHPAPAPATVSRKINIWFGSNENAYLSNMAIRPFSSSIPSYEYFNNLSYDTSFKSVEHAFQARKFDSALNADTPEPRRKAILEHIDKILNAPTGAEAKRLGEQRGILTQEEIAGWDSISSYEMKKLIKESFNQNPQALQKLLDTEDAELTHDQETSKWKTEFPRILMEVRDEFKNPSPQTVTNTTLPAEPMGVMYNGMILEDPSTIEVGEVIGEEEISIPDYSDDDVAAIEEGMGFEFQVSNAESRKSNAENDREFLEAMSKKVSKIPVAVNSLYNAFKKVNGKTFRGMGSEKNIRKALKGLVQDEVIDFLVEGIKEHPELKNMRPYDAFVSLINAFSYDIAKTYNEGIRKPAIKSLDNFLQNYFSKFNIKVDYADLKSRFGNDVTAMFDIIAKTIYIAEGGDINQMTMPEEFAHAYIELMGSVMSKRPENTDFTFLMNTVEDTQIFRDVFNAYKDVYTKDGHPDMYRIKKEALGQALAAALVHNWEMKAETEKQKTFWDKLRELFEKVIQLFKDKEYISFNNQIDKIAREILVGDVSRLRKVDDTGYRLLDYVETIENQNKMDGGKALNFMKYFNGLGNLITGSIAYRRDGTVYRGKLDSLHDIDMVVPKSAHKINIDKIYDTKLNLDQVNLYDYMMKEPYFKKIKADYPKCRFLAAYADKRERRITLNAVYCEDESISERFASYTGSYADRLDRFSESERRQIYLFDFFVESKEFKTEHDPIYGLDMIDSRKPRGEKMFMGRAKDIFDYQMWKDFNEFNNREFSDSNFLMMQRMRKKEEAVNDAIEKSTPLRNEIDESAYSLTEEDWGYLQQRGWIQQSWDRLSEREKERAIDCVRA